MVILDMLIITTPVLSSAFLSLHQHCCLSFEVRNPQINDVLIPSTGRRKIVMKYFNGHLNREINSPEESSFLHLEKLFGKGRMVPNFQPCGAPGDNLSLLSLNNLHILQNESIHSNAADTYQSSNSLAPLLKHIIAFYSK